MKNITWTVRIKSAPTVVRYCKRCCVSTEFASSGLFRVNGQKKSLDVWLIYKCSICDTTWNLTVLSRVAPGSISPTLLRGFYDNDPGLAMSYATDISLIKRNGAETCPPEIEIFGVDADLDESARIHLLPEWPMDIKAETVLRQKLGVSRREFDKLLSGGKLVCVSGHDLKKCKLLSEVVVEFIAE